MVLSFEKTEREEWMQGIAQFHHLNVSASSGNVRLAWNTQQEALVAGWSAPNEPADCELSPLLSCVLINITPVNQATHLLASSPLCLLTAFQECSRVERAVLIINAAQFARRTLHTISSNFTSVIFPLSQIHGKTQQLKQAKSRKCENCRKIKNPHSSLYNDKVMTFSGCVYTVTHSC